AFASRISTPHVKFPVPQRPFCASWNITACTGMARSYGNHSVIIGLPDFFIPQGTQEEARAELGLDAAGIEAKIKAWLA
ncbi:hypothetical protein ONQ97_26125, partial [Salmonella enterica subsp. enterica serovar Virginia]|nr:hypothetical protein [Salmonella enterica subsp. enterica serovar Virginia]